MIDYDAEAQEDYERGIAWVRSAPLTLAKLKCRALIVLAVLLPWIRVAAHLRVRLIYMRTTHHWWLPRRGE